jgi:hypothetical protein
MVGVGCWRGGMGQAAIKSEAVAAARKPIDRALAPKTVRRVPRTDGTNTS